MIHRSRVQNGTQTIIRCQVYNYSSYKMYLNVFDVDICVLINGEFIIEERSI